MIYGLKEIPSEGWQPRYVLSLALGLLCAALFVRRQRAGASPLIPPALVRSPGFTPALLLTVVAAFGMMGSAVFTTQYLQSVLGKSPLEAALSSLLPSVLIGIAGPVTAQLVQRGVHRGYVVAAGFAVSAAGFALLAGAGTDSLWRVLAAAGLLACGAVMVMSQLTDLAMSGAPVERAGTASSLLETGTEFGGALGMAVLGSVGTALYRHEMPATAPAEARETLGGALADAAGLPRPGRRVPARHGAGGVHQRHAGGGRRGRGDAGAGGGGRGGEPAEDRGRTGLGPVRHRKRRPG
ncbi:MFS transporter [Streptomyces tricolor]|nr:MFS transporter [Streptomyces tricolor]